MDFSETFKEEAFEILVELESNLLELENDPENDELINGVFRALHTIKGSGAMFGFDEVSSFAHEVENIYEGVRVGNWEVSPLLISHTLAAQDTIKKMLQGQEGLQDEVKNIVNGLKSATGSKAAVKPVAPSKVPPPAADFEQEECTFRIGVMLEKDILQNGTNPVFLLEEIHALGACDVTANLEKLPALNSMDPEICYFTWDIVLTTVRGMDAIRDVFIFVEDECTLKIEEVAIEEDEPNKKLGEILVERGDISEEALVSTLKKQNPLGKLLTEEGATTPQKINSALAEQKHIRDLKEKQTVKKRISSIRVQSDKLDTLVDLVGELVTVQARLSQTAGLSQDSQLVNIAETVEQLTWELRDSAMSIRMLPIGTTFDKFKRLVRDLSRDLGKDIVLETNGSETELDKNVLEQLNDPMVHLIRNCIDHGIESPEERVSKGKNPKGTITLSAHHAGANVIISIKDDGGGMNKERILKKAREKGLIDSEKDLTEKEIFGLVLLPGFSTNEIVTSTSGRGVGMDVVKKNIESLSGMVEIQSNPGQGTEMKLKLPLTLAIIEGLLVEVSHSFYVLPLSLVEECIELPEENTGNRVINLRGEFVPYIYLHEKFDLEESGCEHKQIVLTHFEDTKVGIVVDRVVGEHQTVIKNLGSMFKTVEDISGATILGDGTLALILDMQKIYQSSKFAESNT